MELQELVEGFAEKVGLGAVAADESGTYWLKIDQFAIGLSADAPSRTLVVHAPIATRDEAVAQGLAEIMLQLNLLYVLTEGGTLALDREAGLYVYQRREALDVLDLEKFTVLVENFVNHAENLSNMVTEFVQNSVAGVPAAEASRPLSLDAFIQV